MGAISLGLQRGYGSCPRSPSKQVAKTGLAAGLVTHLHGCYQAAKQEAGGAWG